jgi:DNA-binding transcriptional MerR regulator
VAEPTPETVRRALLKSADVCDLVKVQPYVLRSWEKEFPDLGVSRSAGGPRFYRQSDVNRVVRIKHLVFAEGLTLAGARRKLEEERAAQEFDEDPPFEDVPISAPSADAKARLDGIRNGLRSLLAMLDGDRSRATAPATRGRGNGHARAVASKEPRLPIDESTEPVVPVPAGKKPSRRRTAARG